MKHGATAKTLFFGEAPHRPEFARLSALAEELQSEMAVGAYLEDKILIQKFISDVHVVERCAGLARQLIQEDTAVCEAAPNSLRYFRHAERNFAKSFRLIRELRERVEAVEAAEDQPHRETHNGKYSSGKGGSEPGDDTSESSKC